MRRVDILLAAYQGEKHLCGQIDSLLRQDIPHWRLIIRDDGSTDETLALAESYHVQYPEQVFLLADNAGNLGVTGNFSALLSASDAPYAMFSDQDDVWYPDKIRKSLERMEALEAEHGADTPLLVHADARIVYEDLRLLHASFADFTQLSPQHSNVARLLVQNTAQGCTMLMNRALYQLAAPIPRQARIHDMWVALVAAACGHIAYLPEPLLDYRQHAHNALGAERSTEEALKLRIRRIMAENRAQAEALHARCQGRMREEARLTVEKFISLPQKPWGIRQLSLLTGSYLRRPLHQNLPVLWYS